MAEQQKTKQLTIELANRPYNVGVLNLVKELCVSVWKRISKEIIQLKPSLTFLLNAQQRCEKVESSMQATLSIVSLRVSDSQLLLQKLYDTIDETLSAVGINDRMIATKKVNEVLSCNSTAMNCKELLDIVKEGVKNIKKHIEDLVQLGLPSPFSDNNIVLMIDEIEALLLTNRMIK